MDRRRWIGCWRQGARLPAVLGAVLLAVGGCAGDPADYGLTGPHPEGVPPVTLTHPIPRSEASVDSPGLNVEAVDRYANLSRMRSSSSTPPLRRYYGYDH